jgi:phage tail sheath protein FI
LESAEYAATVAVELLSVCQSRGDCLALIDPPYGYNTDEVIDWHNGDAPYTDHAALNSSYGALYWPFHKVYDAYTDAEVWIPPSGPASAIIAFSDFIAETWSAPAGLQRGKAKNSIDIEMSPDLGDRELLLGLVAGSNQCVNPFVNFTQDGVVLWGQKTLQRATTALDRVNVRRLLLYVEKLIATVGRFLVFEPNDEKTWRRFISMADSVCAPIKARRGLYDFRIICDETTNTAEVIDQNKMVGKILIKPTKTAEVIVVDWTLLSTGSEFTEYV